MHMPDVIELLYMAGYMYALVIVDVVELFIHDC